MHAYARMDTLENTRALTHTKQTQKKVRSGACRENPGPPTGIKPGPPSISVKPGPPANFSMSVNENELKQGHRHKSRALAREIVKTFENFLKLVKTCENL